MDYLSLSAPTPRHYALAGGFGLATLGAKIGRTAPGQSVSDIADKALRR